MNPRTPTYPPNHPGMWRRLVARTHPDSGGSHDLFIWTLATRDVVCGGELGASIPRKSTTPRSGSPSSTSTPDRVPYHAAFDKAESFDHLTVLAVAKGEEAGEPYAGVLWLLKGCLEADMGDPL